MIFRRKASILNDLMNLSIIICWKKQIKEG
jgi:hypothetical protein